MIFRKSNVWSILLSLFFVCGFSDTYARNAVRQLTNENGLSNNSVNCIFEDSNRIVWIGTWDGLNEYNGRDFKTYHYSSNDSNSISNNIVRQILEQNKEYLWVATDYGVNRFDRQTEKFTQYFLGTKHIMPKQEKSFLLGVTSHGVVVCYVREQGLFYFDDSLRSFVKIVTPELKDVVSLVIDDKDNLFLLQSDGQLVQSSIAFEAKASLRPLLYFDRDNKVSNIFYSNHKVIIVYPGYLKIWDDKNSFPSAINIDVDKSISQVLFKDNRLFISFFEGGCVEYNIEKRTYQPIDNNLKDVSLFSLYIGSQDILWMGTDGQGLLQIYDHHSPFKTIFTNHPVRTFCQASDGRILLGTKGDGVKLFDSKTDQLVDFLSVRNGLISNSVYAIKKNEAGDIFIGTEGEGINVLYANDKRVEKLQISGKRVDFSAVYSIYFSSDSLLWLGTSGHGLIKLSLHKENGRYFADELEQYLSSTRSGALSNNVIYSIVSGADANELWIGTRGGGINIFDMKARIFRSLDNVILSNNDILVLSEWKDQRLWVGTSYGLNKLTLSGVRISPSTGIFTEKEGLPNNTIHGILSDANGNLWISTNRGISFLDVSQNIVENYFAKDGLQNNEFSDGAYYKDEQGIFYFGGVSGFSYFNPQEILLRSFEPEIGLSGLKIYNTVQNINHRIIDNTLKLSYDEPFVTFTFIARDFINNENCEYDYRVLNFSDEWIHNGSNPNVILTKLPPGQYRLEVRATNGDRVWGKNIYSLEIDVAYPWWLSMTAFIVYFILAVIIAYVVLSVVRNRIRLNRQLLLEHVEKQNQQRMHESKLNFFTNIAHEFFTPLTLIYGPAEHLLEKDDLDSYTKRYVKIIKNNADRMQKLISELMEFRKAESGYTPLHSESIDVKLLLDYVSDNYSEISQENKIDYQVTTQNLSDIVSDRNSLEKILFNLISNAFKYTPNSGYIHLIAAQDGDSNLSIALKNSGKGLTEKQMEQIFNQFRIFENSNLANTRSTGVGLSLTKSLVDLLGGTLTVSSVLGEYVEFNLHISPLVKIENESLPEVGVDNGATTIENELEVLDIPVEDKKEISVLLVEDERNIRELLKDILSPYYKVWEAENGEKALSIIEQNKPDIIITDMLMPQLDGLGMIDRLKSNVGTAHIPIISISAKSAVEDFINAYEHGADLYITKPFHPQHVLTAIENLVSKHFALKEYFKSSHSSVTVKDGVTMHHDDEQLLQDIISFIEKHIDDESLSPTSISEYLGLSKASLYRKMKDLTDKTPSEYVRLIRLQHASTLLITTKQTVSEIMFKSGFMNKSYFYREFAKQFGSSPKDYRESKKE